MGEIFVFALATACFCFGGAAGAAVQNRRHRREKEPSEPLDLSDPTAAAGYDHECLVLLRRLQEFPEVATFPLRWGCRRWPSDDVREVSMDRSGRLMWPQYLEWGGVTPSEMVRRGWVHPDPRTELSRRLEYAEARRSLADFDKEMS